MTRLRVIAAGAAVAVSLMVGVWPAAAAAPRADSSLPAATAMSATHAPRAQCNITLHRFKIWRGGCTSTSKSYLCNSGEEGNFPWFPRHAANGCIYRVWIYTRYNQGGQAICLSHHSSTGYLGTDWKSYRIVNNQNTC